MNPKYLELHNAENNTRITININQIKFIAPRENGTFIKLEGDDQIYVTETYDEVLDRLCKFLGQTYWRKDTDESV